MGWYDSTIEILWFHTLFSFFFFLRKQSFMRCCWLPSQTILLSIYLPPNRICRQSFRSSPWQRKSLKCLHAVRSMQTFKLNFLSQLLDEMRYVWKAPEVFFNKKPTSRFHNSTDINYCCCDPWSNAKEDVGVKRRGKSKAFITWLSHHLNALIVHHTTNWVTWSFGSRISLQCVCITNKCIIRIRRLIILRIQHRALIRLG